VLPLPVLVPDLMAAEPRLAPPDHSTRPLRVRSRESPSGLPDHAPRGETPRTLPTRQVLSLIMVTYRSRYLVSEAILSAMRGAEAAGLDVEIVVVDNGSDDGSADHVQRRFPEAIVVRNAENIGFARACNQAFERSSGDWWLLLNPDARIASAAVARLVAFAREHPSAGAVGPTLTGAGTNRAESAGMQPGIRSALGHFLLLNRLLPGDRGGAWRGFQLHRKPGLGPRKVDWASAGVLLVRPAALRSVGGLQPSFFLYAEDVDLGGRLADAGWQTWVLPEAHAHHMVAASSGGVTDLWYVALSDYHARRASRSSALAFNVIAAVGLALRAALASRGPDSEPRRLHARRMKVAAAAAVRCATRTFTGA
jgi:N-acetylglucosaminyl-diphospho-decaprenol L-rhamnosyltransferase